MKPSNWIDRSVERVSRRFARGTSRRHFLTRVGMVLVGGALLPLLPFDRRGSKELFAASAPDQRSDPVQLLALLRHRRLHVQLLRRGSERVSAGQHPFSDSLGRQLHQSGRRPNLSACLSRLLREGQLRPLLLPQHGGRDAGLSAGPEQRHLVVLRRPEHGVSLLERRHRPPRELTRVGWIWVSELCHLTCPLRGCPPTSSSGGSSCADEMIPNRRAAHLLKSVESAYHREFP